MAAAATQDAVLGPGVCLPPECGWRDAARANSTATLTQLELTPLQRGMLATALSEPTAGADVSQVVIRTHEGLDVGALAAAWQRLVDEIPALRVAFDWRSQGQPVQRITEAVTLPLVRPAACLDDYLAADRATPFDLSRAPLMRLALLGQPGLEQQLVWTVHHAIMDGRSIFSALRRFQVLYQARLDGRSPPALRVGDGLQALKARLESVDRAEAQAFWRRQLDGLGAPPPLPLWSPRTDVATLVGRSVHQEIERVLDEALTTRLHALAREHQVTFNTVVQTAWALTLGCFTGERDVLFGSTRAGRPLSAVDGAELLGNFICSVPVRVRIDHGQPLSQLLRQVRAGWVQSRPYELVSPSELQTWAGLPTAQPLFETSVGVERHWLEAALRRDDPAWTQRQVVLIGRAPLPLMLLAYAERSAVLRLAFDTERIGPELAASLLSTVAGLLEEMARKPNAAVGALRYVVTPPAPQPVAPSSRCSTFPELLEHVTWERLDQPAVEHRGRQLSYGQLWEQATVLAGALAARGVRPGDAVVVVVERGLDLARVVVALSRLGAVYTPIEPRHAATQLPGALGYSKVRCVLASSESALPPSTVPVLRLDELVLEARPFHGPSADSPAYALFTSGSTGAPKCVEVSHRSLVDYAERAGRRYGVEPGERCLQLSSLSFDISIEELFVTWGNGGTVVFRPDDAPVGPDELERLLRELAIDAASPPTALWHEWVAALPNSPPPPTLRRVVIGGEAASMAAYREWAASAYGAVRLVNAYGPTECTVSVALFEPALAPASSVALAVPRMPIGRPLAGAQLWVVSDGDRRAPLGAPGELWVGGSCVALGYADAPEATAQRFRELVLDGQSVGPAYRTGDIVIELPGGELYFVERNDRQAKVRGFRVDLEGLEAVLGEHPGVRRSLFVLVGAARDKRLVAYVVREDPRLDEAQVGLHLRAKLPPYAQPDAVVFVDRLPTNTSGKVDVAALPRPTLSRTTPAVSTVDARVDGVAQVVRELWRQHLPGREIGLHDRFFDELGGDSLTAVRLLVDVKARLGCAVPLATLFASQTVATLAAEISALKVQTQVRRAVSLNQRGGPALYLVHGGDGYALAFKDLVRQLPFSCVGFEVGEWPTENGHLTFARLAETYVQELLGRHPTGEVELVGYCSGGLVALEMARLLTERGRRVRWVGLINSYAPGWPQLRPALDRAKLAVREVRERRFELGTVKRLASRAVRVSRRSLFGTTVDEPLSPVEHGLATAQRAWRPFEYTGPVSLFRGTPPNRWSEPEDLGWRPWLKRLQVFPRIQAEHTEMMKGPHAPLLAGQLLDALRSHR